MLNVERDDSIGSMSATKRASKFRSVGLRERFALAVESASSETVELAHKLINNDKVWGNPHVFVTCLIQLVDPSAPSPSGEKAQDAIRQLVNALMSPHCQRLLVELGARSLVSEHDAKLLARITLLMWKLWNQAEIVDDIAELLVKFIQDCQSVGIKSPSTPSTPNSAKSTPQTDHPIPAMIFQTLLRILVQDDQIIPSGSGHVEDSKEENVIMVMKTIIRCERIIPAILQLISKADLSCAHQSLTILSGLLEDPENAKLFACCSNWQQYLMQILQNLFHLIGPYLKQMSMVSQGDSGVKLVFDVKENVDEADKSVYAKVFYLIVNIYVAVVFINYTNAKDEYIFELSIFPIQFLKQYRGWTQSSVLITRMFLYALSTKLQSMRNDLHNQPFTSPVWKNLLRVCKAIEYFVFYCPIPPPDVKMEDITLIFGIHLTKGNAEDILLVNRVISLLSDYKESNFDVTLYPNIDKDTKQHMIAQWDILQKEKAYFQKVSVLLQRICSKESFQQTVELIHSRQLSSLLAQRALEAKEIIAALNYCRRRSATDLNKMTCHRAILHIGKSSRFGKDIQRKVLIDIEEYTEEDHESQMQLTGPGGQPVLMRTVSATTSSPDHRRSSSTDTRFSRKKRPQEEIKDFGKSQTLRISKHNSVTPGMLPQTVTKTAHSNFRDCRCFCLLIRDYFSTVSALFPIEEIEISAIETMFVPRFSSAVESRLRQISSPRPPPMHESVDETFEKEEIDRSTPQGAYDQIDFKEVHKLVFQLGNSDALRDLYFITDDERTKFVNKCKELNPQLTIVRGPTDYTDPATIQPQEVPECEVGCGTKFTLLTRKSVCFRCRKTCCRNCSNFKMALPEFDYDADGSIKYRVCSECVKMRNLRDLTE
jgi:hypothetical protein